MTDDTPMSPEAPEPLRHYTVLDDDAWTRVRADYLAGTPAAEVCDRYGVSRSALHARAARHGWRRVDQPRLDRSIFIEVSGDDDPSYFDFMEMARLRLRHAITRGHAREAEGWLKMLRQLRLESLEWDALPDEMDSLDSLDTVAESDPLTPGTRLPPEKPVPAVSSPAPAPRSGAGTARTAR